MIDVQFAGRDKRSREVRDAWKAYLHLNTTNIATEVWISRGDDLFVDLVYGMAIALGYDFAKTHLRRMSYYPRGYGEAEWDAINIRRGFHEVLEGKRWIPVAVGQFGGAEPQQAELGTPQELAKPASSESAQSEL